MKKHYIYLFASLLILLESCGTKRAVNQSLEIGISETYFSGLVVFNPSNGDTLVSYNAEKYFTPASTLKLFTLYASLHYLADSIATISYYDQEERRYFKALADPSFLFDSLPNTTYSFLKNTNKELILIPDDFHDSPYGDGWQWDDYQYYYMPEMSLFPIFGNTATLKQNHIQPSYFQDRLKEAHPQGKHRDFLQNTFYKDSLPSYRKRHIPFKTSLELSRQLLSDTLQKPVYMTDIMEEVPFKPYISTPTYPIYKKLMDESENFIAEQLFLILSKKKTNKYLVKNGITYTLDSLLFEIPNKPRWVDASGLSRYNLFTPKSMIFLLDKMYRDIDREMLFDLLPKNGIGGGLQKWYPAKNTYLYAKTGSLSNNHNIAGFLRTKKGTLLIFSYMNNNYMIASDEVRTKMNHVLQQIYKEH